MPITTAFKTEIPRISILDEHGNFDEKLGKGLIPDADLIKLYEAMFTCRRLDDVAFRLQRSGRMGTYPQNMGQEATSLGAAYALDKKDWLVTCYRENCGLFWRGVPMEAILLHWMGDERGNAMPRPHFATPIAVPIGTQMLHATGLAWASKYRGEKQIACTFFGDGAMNEGAFHEAANLAAIWQLPMILFCENNKYGMSSSTEKAFAIDNLADRGKGYGIPGVNVDGNDVVAVYEVAQAAVDRAKAGDGPTLIIAETYRWKGHSRSDKNLYRTKEEIEEWRTKDPIPKFIARAIEAGLLTQEQCDAIQNEAIEAIKAAVNEAVKAESAEPSGLLDAVFKVVSA